MYNMHLQSTIEANCTKNSNVTCVRTSVVLCLLCWENWKLSC